MPVINDSTVVASSYTTNAGARPLITTNGNLFSIVKVDAYEYRIYKSVDKGVTWALIATEREATFGINYTSFQTNGTLLYVLYSVGEVYIKSKVYDQSGVTKGTVITIDSTNSMTNRVSLEINPLGTELHACWESRSATYPNSFNIRYAKGNISAVDGGVTWGTVEQVTMLNTSGQNILNPRIIVIANGKPAICWVHGHASINGIGATYFDGSTWVYSASNVRIYNSGIYPQSSPTAIFVPSSINGLANGRIWIVWHGLDATDTTKNNIRISYSDDNGVTWSAIDKRTTGNTIDRLYPAITANKNNEIFIDYQDGTGINQQKAINNVWASATTKVATGTLPSTLYDSTFNFSEPILIYRGASKVGFYGSWTITTISVTQGILGSKSDKSNLLSYSITTDGTMSTITEQINGITIGTKTATSGQSLIAGLTQAQWDAIKYGKYKDATGGLNTLTVTMGVNTWTYTFDKKLATSDDISTAMKALQDSQTTVLPSVKDMLVNKVGGSTSDSFENIISGITLGKKWAKGSGCNVNTTDFYKRDFTVTGLDFVPSLVIIWSTSVYKTLLLMHSINVVPTYAPFIIASSTYTPSTLTYDASATNYLMMGGFRFEISRDVAPFDFTWVAIE